VTHNKEYEVEQLAEAFLYRLGCRGFDSRSGQWDFSLTSSLRPHSGPGAVSASNRSDYEAYLLGAEGGRCAGLTTLPHSCPDCREIL